MWAIQGWREGSKYKKTKSELLMEASMSQPDLAGIRSSEKSKSKGKTEWM